MMTVTFLKKQKFKNFIHYLASTIICSLLHIVEHVLHSPLQPNGLKFNPTTFLVPPHLCFFSYSAPFSYMYHLSSPLM